MQISSNRNQSIKFNPSFSGIRLCRVNLKHEVNGVSEYIPAYFTRLTQKDVPFLEEAMETFKGTLFTNLIISRFFESLDRKITPENCRRRFFMIEVPNSETPDKKLKALAETTIINNNSMCLDYIQSTGSADVFNTAADKVSGAGASMIYGLTKLGEKLKLKRIHLFSLDDDTECWYKAMGFSVGTYDLGFDMFMKADKFKEFQSFVRDKYKY